MTNKRKLVIALLSPVLLGLVLCVGFVSVLDYAFTGEWRFKMHYQDLRG